MGCQGSLRCVGLEAWHAAPVFESDVALVGEGAVAFPTGFGTCSVGWGSGMALVVLTL